MQKRQLETVDRLHRECAYPHRGDLLSRLLGLSLVNSLVNCERCFSKA